MSLANIERQSYYLYDCNWNADRDSFLIQSLIGMKEECQPTPPHKSIHAVLSTLSKLNQRFNTTITLADIDERIGFLEGRYRSFTRISARPDTFCDMERNEVIAAEIVWKKMIQEDKFAEAYYWRSEIEYTNLCLLFEPDKVKVEPSRSRTVILISDSPTTKAAQSIPSSNDTQFSDDEVTSPPLNGSYRLVRRLFYEGDDKAAKKGKQPCPLPGRKWATIEKRLKKPSTSTCGCKPSYGDANHDFGDGDDGGVGHSSCASSWSPWK